MERYEAYKDSNVEWIGEIPEGWETTVFSRVCNASLGKMLTNVPKTDVSFAAPYLKAANLQEDGFALQNLQSMYFEPDEAEQYGLDKGDLLVVEGGSVGLAHVWDGSIDNCYIQNALHRVRPREGFSAQYLKYCLDAARNSGYVDLVCNKATIAHFTKEKLLATPLAVPPLAEQQAIADFLDAKTAEIDGLVADCEREVELLQEYRKAVISEAVTKGLDPHAPMKDSGAEWIGEIPEGWRCYRLKQIAQITSGATPNRNVASYWNGTIPWVKTGELNFSLVYETKEYITNSALSETSVQIYPAGTILMAMYGQGKTRGTTGMLAIPSTTNQACAAIRAFPIGEPNFIWQSLIAGYDAIRGTALGSGQPNLSLEQIGNFHIALPPSIAEQREIVSYLDAKTTEIDGLIEAKRQMAEKLREYRKSLISEAVTGKFKVPGVA